MLLQCALGDLSMYDPTGLLTLENLKNVLDSRALKKASPNACCLLHSEEIVRKLVSSANNSYNNTTVKKKVITNSFMLRSPKASDLKSPTHSNSSGSSLHIPLLEALKMGNRFSEQFIDFLCNCLKLDEGSRMNDRELLCHNFLSEDHSCKGPNISLKEFLKIGVKDHIDHKQVIANIKHNHLEKFTEALNVVFLNGSVKEKFLRMLKKDPLQKLEEKKIQELAQELEVSPTSLWQHVQTCIRDMKSHND